MLPEYSLSDGSISFFVDITVGAGYSMVSILYFSLVVDLCSTFSLKIEVSLMTREMCTFQWVGGMMFRI